MTEPTDPILRAWLLGSLPTAEAEALELRVLRDDDFGARLREIETDLLDDLAAGRLAPDERERAEARFGASAFGRTRRRIARALLRARASSANSGASTRRSGIAGTSSRRPRGRWIAAALASAAGILVAVGLWRHAPSDHADATITLLADRQRGTGVEAIDVPREAKTIRLEVETDRLDARYALRIEDETHETFQVDGLAPRVAGPYMFVEALVPKSALDGGEHTVRLRVSGGNAQSASWSIRLRDE
jgi:hypothetical protein